MMQELIHSELFLLTLTVGVYYGALTLYKRFKLAILNPILVSVLVIMPVLGVLKIDFQEYYEANSILNFLLGVSVVTLGYLLYENIEQLRGREISILVSTFSGAFIGVASVVVMAKMLGIDDQITASLQPKSVTMPIALALSKHAGGIMSLTSMAVIFVGIFGNIAGPSFLRLLGVKSPVATGLALGSGSHAVGTAKAMELGAIQGAVSGAAIGLVGVFTSLSIPVIDWLTKIL